MSLSISAIPTGNASLDTLDASSFAKKPLSSSANPSGNASNEAVDASSLNKKPLPSPTAAQQVEQLALTGQPASVIATALGIPISQVNDDLGVISSTTSETNAVTALAGRLSIQA